MSYYSRISSRRRATRAIAGSKVVRHAAKTMTDDEFKIWQRDLDHKPDIYDVRKELRDLPGFKNKRPWSPVPQWNRWDWWEQGRHPVGKWRKVMERLKEAKEGIEELKTEHSEMTLGEIRKLEARVTIYEAKMTKWEEELEEQVQREYATRLLQWHEAYVQNTGLCAGNAHSCSRKPTNGVFCWQHEKCEGYKLDPLKGKE